MNFSNVFSHANVNQSTNNPFWSPPQTASQPYGGTRNENDPAHTLIPTASISDNSHRANIGSTNQDGEPPTATVQNQQTKTYRQSCKQ